MWYLMVIPVLLIVIPDVYMWHYFINNSNTILRMAYWVPTGFAFFSLLLGMTGFFQERAIKIFFLILLCLAVPKLIFSVFSILGKGSNILIPYTDYIGNIIGSILAVTAVLISVYGFTHGWKRFTVKEFEFKSKDIPNEFKGYRIVQLSDLHIGTFNHSPEALSKMVNKVNSLNPDLIVFTGDLVNSSPNELEPFKDVLASLKSKDGIYSVLGNHDYCYYQKYDNASEQKRNIEKIINIQKEMNWNLLKNEHVIIKKGDSEIVLIGVENDGRPPFPAYADLRRAMNGLTDDSFKILLSHDPSHWRKEILPDTDIALTLSGHTHAMQFKIGNFSPSKWTYKEWGGLHSQNDQHLYVNTGTGGNVPFRFGAWPEITLLILDN